MDSENQGWLKGWKEISKYLGRSQRTLQRWEKSGLPIMRDPAGRPIAKPEHIDRWLIKLNEEEFDTPGVNAALEIEREAKQELRAFEEKIINAQRMNRARY